MSVASAEETQVRMVAAARSAAENAYAPYSGFRVGAAVLAEDSRIFTGCNVENASYGLTLCAERNAVAQAIAHGSRGIRAVVVYTPTDAPTPPCGACRQVLVELAPHAEVICVCDGSERLVTTASELLPSSFNGGHLGD